MTILKSRLFALLLALTLAGTANASTSALTFDLDGNAVFGKTIAVGFASFDDFFTFSVPGANTGNVSADVLAGIKFLPSFGFLASLTAFDLYSGTPSGGTFFASGSLIGSPGFAGYAGATGLTVGSYYLNVKGSITDTTRGGSYSGNVNLTVTPVPEPGEWALMMSGLGLIGFMVRRRTSRSA